MVIFIQNYQSHWYWNLILTKQGVNKESMYNFTIFWASYTLIVVTFVLAVTQLFGII